MIFFIPNFREQGVFQQNQIASPVPTSVFPAGSLESRVRRCASDQVYFLTAFSMAPPALARSSGIMTG